MDPLPAIPKSRHALVEVSSSSSSKTPIMPAGAAIAWNSSSPISAHAHVQGGHGLQLQQGDSGHESVLCSRASGGARSPSPLLLKAANISLSPRPHSPVRKSADFLRATRAEVDKRDQLISSLRAETQQLQSRLRELEKERTDHTALFSLCSKLAQTLGCCVEGVAVEAMEDILCTRTSRLVRDCKHLEQQCGGYRSQLDTARGDLAAAQTCVSSLEGELRQSRSRVSSKEAGMQELRDQVQRAQQDSARSSAMLQSVREQLQCAEGRARAQASSDASGTGALQVELGRLKKELADKEESVVRLTAALHNKEEEGASLMERASSAEAAHSALCGQLATVLQLEDSEALDEDCLISKVSSVLQSCKELEVRMDSMSSAIRSAELDSSASRETILRLSSEAKAHKKDATKILELERGREELRDGLGALERERDVLLERLGAAKEEVMALKQELQQRDKRFSNASLELRSLQESADDEKMAAQSVKTKFQDFKRSVGTLVGSDCHDDSVELLNDVRRLTQNLSKMEKEAVASSGLVEELQTRCSGLCSQLSETQERLDTENTCIARLQGECTALGVVREGMDKELDRHQSFYRKLAGALHMDTATAEILSGEFAEDAVLTRAEQLARQETQLLAEKTSALYSCQRKLKALRQLCESRELHLGLLQKKAASLEGRLATCSRQEAQWEAGMTKARKVERQMERLQEKTKHQQLTLDQLRTENQEIERLRLKSADQAEVIERLRNSIDELSQLRVQQAQHLAETRQKVEKSVAKEQAKIARLEADSGGLREELELSKRREKELYAFRKTVEKLLGEGGGSERASVGEGSNSSSCSDYELASRLEQAMGRYRQYQQSARQVGASLRQMELGFRSGYNDTLTLLGSDDTN